MLRKAASAASRVIPKSRLDELRAISGSWHLAFQTGRGAPESIELQRLESWSEFEDGGVRYFSGVGTYTQSVRIPAAWSHRRLFLDLGTVHEVASIRLNGRLLATVWKPPYRIEITGSLKEGLNQLSVEVANLWVNRLIGDAQPGAHAYTLTSGPTYLPDAPLRRSGLLGPVRILELH